MLPRDSSIKQLKRLRELTKGTDIGDITANDRLNMDQPNLQYVGNPIDKHIDSYEEFEETDSKLQTIAFKSKLVNKPLVKEHADHKMIKIKCPYCDETRTYDVDKNKKQVKVTCNDCKRTITKTIKENNNNDMKEKIIKFENFENLNEGFYGSFSDWYSENRDSEILKDEYREYLYDIDKTIEKPLTFRQWCKERYNSLNESKEPEYEMWGKEKELKSNPLFGVAAVKDEENKKIAFFNNFAIDPPTPKERSILNAGQFIDNDSVKGFVNRIEGKDVYVESVEEPMVIKKFSLKDAVKTKKE